MLLKIDDETYIVPTEIVSIVADATFKVSGDSPSDTCMVKDFEGSKITLKNGRKIFVKNKTPDEILKILEHGE